MQQCSGGERVCGDCALAFDSSGNLWVATAMSVLEFVPPFHSGMAATVTIGVGTTTDEPPAADILDTPDGIALDSAGDLIVSDSLNSRVLIFKPPFTTGMDATTLIGQPNMTAGASGTCDTCGPASAETLCKPGGGVVFW